MLVGFGPVDIGFLNLNATEKVVANAFRESLSYSVSQVLSVLLCDVQIS